MGIMSNLNKAITKVSDITGAGLDLVLAKAKRAIISEQRRTFSRKALVSEVDLDGHSSLYLEKGSMISFDALRQLAERDMIVAAVVGKLTNRVAAFAQPQKDKYSLGFCIRVNPEYYTEAKVDPKDETQKQEITELVKFILNTGSNDSDRPIEDRMNFETYLRLIVRDRLVYNQIGTECITANDGSLLYFLPVSGGSIRHVSKSVLKNLQDPAAVIHSPVTAMIDDEKQAARQKANEETTPADILYAQVYLGQICAVFTNEDFIYRQGIPSVDLAHNGYSPGELEILVNTVANHRIAETHNERFFRFGFGSDGILNIKADVTEEDLQGIKRQFQRQYQGVRNAFKMPIMSAKDGIEYVRTGSSNRDMEWSAWMEYLIKIITAVYGISPAEINFDISRGTGSTIGDGGQRNEIMLRDTRNSLLRPLLRWLQGIVNDEIIPRYNPEFANKYVFEFVGLDHEDHDAELDRIKKKITTYMTVNEIRAAEGLESLGEAGDMILDTVYFQNINAMRTAQQQSQTPDGGGGGMEAETVSDSVLDDIFGETSELDPLSNDTEALKLSLRKHMQNQKPKNKLIKVEYWKS